MLHARFDDRLAGTVVRFGAPERLIEARTPEEVRPALRAVQEAVDAGAWAYGMLAYEAAAGLDPDARVRPGAAGLPLAWFGIASAPVDGTDRDGDDPDGTGADAPGAFAVEPWRGEWTAAQHAERVAAVRERIAEGETYQVNLTHRLRGRIRGDLEACYRELLASQQAAHCAYLDLGRWAVLSASPESFLHRRGSTVTCVPMKGTAPRGEGAARDAEARARLLRSEKERAENVMIADLLRNDLARIARPGSVRVPRLLQAEPYPTLWQLTSTVTAEVDPSLGLEQLMEALFPCGSITGAPKLSTMGIIAELETSPRGVYCGAIGLLSPHRRDAHGEHPAQSRFSVAIRTVVVDREDGAAEYGVGGGITWSSRPEAEWEELRTKARILAHLERPVGTPGPAPAAGVPSAEELAAFGLLETLASVDGRARHLEEHLDRLEASAAHFAIPVRRSRLRALIEAAARAAGDAVVRLHLALDGTPAITTRPLPATDDAPVRLAIDAEAHDPDAPAVRHKTTDRAHLGAALERARALHGAVDDVVLRGRDGRITETTIASLAVRLDGRWWTPPLEDGCLPGVGRRLALERGELRERPLSVADLRAAEEIALISSVRGRRRAVLLPPPEAARGPGPGPSTHPDRPAAGR